MKYLLDTHVFLWSISNPKELTKKAIAAIKNPENDIYVSAISLWEIAIKLRLKKLEIKGIGIEELPDVIEKMDYEVMSMTPEDAIEYANLTEETHKDPFDRMLIVQSISKNMVMISKDTQFGKFTKFGLKLLWD
jgi:PIN domain nuclease of toxin-antitoxin system